MSEDCLYLNVYTPQLPEWGRGPRLPVLVWMHGGAFKIGDGGTSLYGPEHFMEDGGIVVVTVNYRLGLFGFLAVGTAAAPGNMGLKDQSLALRWVRDNIERFGGDPDQVTLYGESAGGVAVHLHTLSPLSKGLFHRVITSSGMAGCDWGVNRRPLALARELGAAVGLDGDDLHNPDRLVEALRRMRASSLFRGQTKTGAAYSYSRCAEVFAFVAVVEPALDGAFLCEDPIKIVAEGRQMHVPMITGVNSREGLLIFLGMDGKPTGRWSDRLKTDFVEECRRQQLRSFLPVELCNALPEQAKDHAGAAVLDHYFGEKGVLAGYAFGVPEKYAKGVLMRRLKAYRFLMQATMAYRSGLLVGDLMFVVPALRTSRLQAETSTAPVYFYHFSYDGDTALFKTLFGLHEFDGVGHADELGYVFRAAAVPQTYKRIKQGDATCRGRMLSLWTNFIRTGNPTPPECVRKTGVEWRPRTQEDLLYLEIGDEVRMKCGKFHPDCTFWDEIFRKYLKVGLL